MKHVEFFFIDNKYAIFNLNEKNMLGCRRYEMLLACLIKCLKTISNQLQFLIKLKHIIFVYVC